MLILNVKYNVKPGLRDEFFKAILGEGLDELSRNEEGNICYDYFFSTDDPNQLFLVEHWQDVEAFRLHTTLTHFKRLQQLKDKYVVKAELLKTLYTPID